MNARLSVFGPIANPRDWVIAPDNVAPPGYMQLCSLSINRRSPAKIPGTALVPREDLDALRTQLQRLLRAFERLGAAERSELISFAERLAS
jgi:hypothetical protein